MELLNDKDAAEPKTDPGKGRSGFASATWKLKLAAVVVPSSLFLAMLWWLGNHITLEGESLTRIVHIKAYRSLPGWFGKPAIGIYEADPVIGWRNKPSSEGRHY
ncbi:MAG: hypothetical protein AAB316_06060, partial [Bacteroidota bacterium]